MENNTNNTAVTPLRPDDDAPAFRNPPTNVEAEQALLGAILVNNRAFEQVSEFLRSEHFAVPVHCRIFDAIRRQVERGQEANPTTLQFFFEGDAELKDMGGHVYLARLAASAVTVINARDYGRTIHDLFLRRQLINLGEDTVNEAYSQEIDDRATDQIERAEQRLYDLATIGDYQGGFQDFPSVLTNAIKTAEAAYKRDGQLIGVSTGLTDLDALLGGLHDSDLIILAGRPSMGKTALATNIAYSAARNYRTETDETGNEVAVDGAVVGFFSLEMSAEQLATRILSETAEVGSDAIRRGKLSSAEFHKIVEASHELQRAPIFIDDTPALTVSALRTRARRLKRQHGLGLIVVDYLQLMQVPGNKENRATEISEISRSLKALAKELNVPVVALSQLSRAVESRNDKRPMMSDLRESGAIEQDADVIVFIYRDEVYDEDSADKGIAEIIIGKQRNGPIGRVFLTFLAQHTRFENFAPEELTYDNSFLP